MTMKDHLNWKPYLYVEDIEDNRRGKGLAE